MWPRRDPHLRCSWWVTRESSHEPEEQNLKETGTERVPGDFTKKYLLGHIPSPFFALKVSSCDRPMTHGRAGSLPPVLLMLASPRAPNCRLKLMVFGPLVSSHKLSEAFAFILLGEALLSNQK